MNLLIWACVAQLAWPSAFAVYFTGSREVFKPPGKVRNNSYFGYSITYDEEYKKIVISAPRENDIGMVYDCNIPDKSCTPILNNNTIERVFKSNYTHDYWFGATVKAGRDFVMMCAPRYTAHYDRYDTFVTFGMCYSHAKGKLTPKRTILEQERNKDSKKGPMEARMDSFGWSIDVASDDSVIVGGPGMFHGRAMIYKPNKPIPIFMRTNDKTPEFNFGYAVSSGMFIDNHLSYAVSSTYGMKGKGEVAFFADVTLKYKLPKQVDNDVVGSMFGAVLCAATLSGRKTDLLVGAPTYAYKSTYNLGAVYVYRSNEKSRPPIFKRKLVGVKSGSLFGSAIINVGDLNGDDRHEIAIGAPFENSGSGVVYLYSGADLVSDKTDVKCLQKIDPEPSYANSFGMSLTPLLDYDQNGCNELAIGSPFTDRVLLLRCMAAIIVRTQAVELPNLQGRTISRKSKFDLKVTLAITYPKILKKFTALLSTTMEINHAYAKLATPDSMGRMTINTTLDAMLPEYKLSFPFILPVDGKYETEVNFQITTTLLKDPRHLKGFDASRVILSDRSNLNYTVLLWAAECAGNRTCVPILNLIKPKISFAYPDHDYIIGSSDTEYIDLTIHNSGEVAYDPCVRVHIVGALVLKPPTACTHETSTDGDRLLCAPPKPIQNNQSWSTDKIMLEMTHLTNLDDNITFTTYLYSRCNNVVPVNNTIVTLLKPDPSGITAKGETDIGSPVNITKEEVQVKGKKMQHVYTISNSGPTNWVGLDILVILPEEPYIKYEDNPVTVYDSTFNVYEDCSLVLKEEKGKKTYQCRVENLKAKVQFAKILIPMNVIPGTLDGILEEKNVTIMSTIKLLLNSPKAARVVTTIVLQDSSVPLETIIITVIVGLIILLIITVILYRVGFLRRKNKKALNDLRRTVRRQTIQRQSMMTSPALPADDRRQILERMKEEEEVHANS